MVNSLRALTGEADNMQERNISIRDKSIPIHDKNLKLEHKRIFSFSLTNKIKKKSTKLCVNEIEWNTILPSHLKEFRCETRVAVNSTATFNGMHTSPGRI